MTLFISFLVIVVVIVFLKNYQQMKMKRVYKERLKAYQTKHKLSESDLLLFKEVMGAAKEQIIEWEITLKKSNRLKKIKNVKVGLVSAKEIFKDLMNHPDEITEVHEFLYTKLPGVLDATQKFIVIEASTVNTKEINDSLNAIQETIVLISESITDDYEELIKEDVSDVDITKQMVMKK
ncbi:MAG: 5-bromo-4-chloroindolyl phosphate hydrolysis family protein [Vagococcus sp.]|uniref:5-bromo-4-chloroindolyl phosphate hydrolysis family protein n=1 Tax=Vagococcus sp. TaxID=1933889 RepID=UPI002FCB38EA